MIEKLILSIPMSLLVISINLLFRDKKGISITVNIFVSMGIVVKIAQMALQFLGLGGVAKVLDFTITGASTFITMTPGISILPVAGIAIVWTFVLAFVANGLMNKRDIL